jgi:rubrerythrin
MSQEPGLTFTLAEIFDIAMNLERNGQEFYEQSLKRVIDKKVKEFLIHLRDQEINHLHTFARLKEAHAADKKPAPKLPPEMTDLLQTSMTGHLLSWDERPDIDHNTTFAELLDAALEFERDSVLFFQFMRELVELPEEREIIDRIVEEENHHVEQLSRMKVENERNN